MANSMIPDSLKTFLEILYEHGALQRIGEPVDSELEISTIVDRVCKGQAHNKALLFANVKGSPLPVAVNLFGSHQRMALALGVDSISDLANRFRLDLESVGEATSSQALRRLIAQDDGQVVIDDNPQWHEVDHASSGLSVLPALKSWPLDGGRYLTLGQVFSRSPESTSVNCGIYRIQIVDNHTALLRCHRGSGGAGHMKAWHHLGKPMPVVIVLGGPPALTWASGVSLPEDVSEIDFVRYLTGSAMPLCQAYTTTFKIPASAEIVIEGKVEPGEEMLEGPFGNHTGSYASPTPAPVIKVDSIRMKSDAIYPCTVVGPPPMENGYMARAAERLLLQMLQYDHPWVSDVHMPVEGIYHRAALVTVARNAALPIEDIQQALLTSQLLRRSRFLVLLDDGVELENLQQVYWHIINKLNCIHHPEGVLLDARSSQSSIQVHQNPAIEGLVSKQWPKYGL